MLSLLVPSPKLQAYDEIEAVGAAADALALNVTVTGAVSEPPGETVKAAVGLPFPTTTGAVTVVLWSVSSRTVSVTL